MAGPRPSQAGGREITSTKKVRPEEEYEKKAIFPAAQARRARHEGRAMSVQEATSCMGLVEGRADWLWARPG